MMYDIISQDMLAMKILQRALHDNKLLKMYDDYTDKKIKDYQSRFGVDILSIKDEEELKRERETHIGTVGYPSRYKVIQKKLHEDVLTLYALVLSDKKLFGAVENKNTLRSPQYLFLYLKECAGV